MNVYFRKNCILAGEKECLSHIDSVLTLVKECLSHVDSVLTLVNSEFTGVSMRHDSG